VLKSGFDFSQGLPRRFQRLFSSSLTLVIKAAFSAFFKQIAGTLNKIKKCRTKSKTVWQREVLRETYSGKGSAMAAPYLVAGRRPHPRKDLD